MSRDRNDAGRFVETVTLEDVLGVFDLVAGPVVTTGDVADHLDCSREAARQKLRRLDEQGRVRSRKTAGRVVYWRTDAAEPAPVNPDDPLFTDRPSFSSGRGDLSERVDELLYGDGK